MQQTALAQQDAKRHAVVTGSLPHHFSPFFCQGSESRRDVNATGLAKLAEPPKPAGDPSVPQDAWEGLRNWRTIVYSDLSLANVEEKTSLGDTPNSAEF